MADVEKIEASIGEDDALTLRARTAEPGEQLFYRKDLRRHHSPIMREAAGGGQGKSESLMEGFSNSALQSMGLKHGH